MLDCGLSLKRNQPVRSAACGFHGCKRAKQFVLGLDPDKLIDMPRLLRKSSQDAHRLFRLWYDQSGQIAIFVALIFQVLFVFFAMSINVALVVHDKINLQNSVDLAAYYMAQRQAEVLNVMAHQNYAIRQTMQFCQRFVTTT